MYVSGAKEKPTGSSLKEGTSQLFYSSHLHVGLYLQQERKTKEKSGSQRSKNLRSKLRLKIHIFIIF